MDIVLFGIGFVVLGSAVTVLIGTWLPQSVLQCAHEHGRFAEFSEGSPPSVSTATYGVGFQAFRSGRRAFDNRLRFTTVQRRGSHVPGVRSSTSARRGPCRRRRARGVASVDMRW